VRGQAIDGLSELATDSCEDQGVGDEARAHRDEVAGHELLFDASGVVVWPNESILIVADLHLEKGSSHAERRIFLPPYDTAATLAALTKAIHCYAPKTVICLGDSFHDRRAARRIADGDRETIFRLQAGRNWFWVSGNHDPEAPTGLGGDSCDELGIGNLIFRHEPTAGPTPGEIAGHLHPAARIRGRGRSVRRRCFASDGTRLVLPAFGAFTGGLNVLDPAWSGIFSGRRFTTCLIGENRLFPIPARALLRDRLSGDFRMNKSRTRSEAGIPGSSD